jgi:TolA-binding protein
LGESYYVKRQYPQALAAFQSLTVKFPDSSKASDSWLKIGYSYYEMDDLAKAETNLQKVVDSYPNTSIARLAKNRLLQLRRDN